MLFIFFQTDCLLTFSFGDKTTATTPPIIIKEHPTICRHPNGSSVRILELTAPTIISDKKRIEHIPAPI